MIFQQYFCTVVCDCIIQIHSTYLRDKSYSTDKYNSLLLSFVLIGKNEMKVIIKIKKWFMVIPIHGKNICKKLFSLTGDKMAYHYIMTCLGAYLKIPGSLNQGTIIFSLSMPVYLFFH